MGSLQLRHVQDTRSGEDVGSPGNVRCQRIGIHIGTFVQRNCFESTASYGLESLNSIVLKPLDVLFFKWKTSYVIKSAACLRKEFPRCEGRAFLRIESVLSACEVNSCQQTSPFVRTQSNVKMRHGCPYPIILHTALHCSWLWKWLWLPSKMSRISYK